MYLYVYKLKSLLSDFEQIYGLMSSVFLLRMYKAMCKIWWVEYSGFFYESNTGPAKIVVFKGTQSAGAHAH